MRASRSPRLLSRTSGVRQQDVGTPPTTLAPRARTMPHALLRGRVDTVCQGPCAWAANHPQSVVRRTFAGNPLRKSKR
uniref:Uncharacterized protein n=1 Tax=Ralstonia solanacearum TaxID=305 RepID=A0A0S4TW09_RALSL|nr:protein of unknown function [Ralstonia solanacearum]